MYKRIKHENTVWAVSISTENCVSGCGDKMMIQH